MNGNAPKGACKFSLGVGPSIEFLISGLPMDRNAELEGVERPSVQSFRLVARLGLARKAGKPGKAF